MNDIEYNEQDFQKAHECRDWIIEKYFLKLKFIRETIGYPIDEATQLEKSE